MNSFTRGLSVALLSLGLLGLTGCGADNETEAQKLSKGLGDPGPASTKGKAIATSPPPASREEAGKISQENQTQGKKGSKYPGAPK